jgi:hypothetical protein
VKEDLLEVRYRPDQRLDAAGMREIMAERERLCPQGPYRVLAVLPEGGDFDLNVMLEDHCKDRGLENCTRALAIATQSRLAQNMVELYFAYFPQKMDVRIFQEECDARAWLIASASEASAN